MVHKAMIYSILLDPNGGVINVAKNLCCNTGLQWQLQPAALQHGTTGVYRCTMHKLFSFQLYTAVRVHVATSGPD